MVKVESEHTLAPSFQRVLALSQSALVSGWLEVPAHTFAASFQLMLALSHSTLVSGWLGASAANVIEATINPVANAKIETTAFITPAHECFEGPSVTRTRLQAIIA